MNDPIVSPWLIYAIAQVDNVRATACVFLALCITVTVICGVTWQVEKEGGPEDATSKRYRNGMFISGFLMMVSGLLLCVIPSSKTLMLMCVAEKATPANIAKIKGSAAEAYTTLKTDVFNSIEKAKQ
jgi:uncharacterized membrane protein